METDESILPSKAKGALKNYGHQLVVGNLLSNHKDKVILYQKDGSEIVVEKTEQEKHIDYDLEAKLIPIIAKLHSQFIEEQNKH